MNKQKLILSGSILLGCVILGVFYYASKTNRKTSNDKPQIVKPEETIKADDFTKKIECEKYRDSIAKTINQYNNSQTPEIRNSNNTGTEDEAINHLYVENKELKEVFYSPKVNSCLYLEISRTLMKSDPHAKANEGSWGTSFEYYNLIDALTGNQIDSVFTINRSERMDSYNSDGLVTSNIYNEVSAMVDEYKK